MYAAVLAAAIPYVLGISSYTVMPDELGYMKQAVHFGETWRPSISGDVWFNSYAQLGPLLFAPGYALLSTPDAFDVAHVVSVIVFASTIFPVYLLTRMVTGDYIAALLGAILAVAVPWLSMTASLMTEPIAYPLFAWSILAMTRAVERRTLAADAIALAAIGGATLARTQLLVLGAAYVAAVAIFALRAPDRRAELRAALRGHRLLLGAAGFGFLLLIVSPWTVLGAYAAPLAGDLAPPEHARGYAGVARICRNRHRRLGAAPGDRIHRAYVVAADESDGDRVRDSRAEHRGAVRPRERLGERPLRGRNQRPLSLFSGAGVGRRRRRAARGPAAGDSAASCRRRPRRGAVRDCRSQSDGTVACRADTDVHARAQRTLL